MVDQNDCGWMDTFGSTNCRTSWSCDCEICLVKVVSVGCTWWLFSLRLPDAVCVSFLPSSISSVLLDSSYFITNVVLLTIILLLACWRCFGQDVSFFVRLSSPQSLWLLHSQVISDVSTYAAGFLLALSLYPFQLICSSFPLWGHGGMSVDSCSLTTAPLEVLRLLSFCMSPK